MNNEINSKVETTCETCGATFDAPETDNPPCCESPEEATESVTVRITPLPSVFGNTLR